MIQHIKSYFSKNWKENICGYDVLIPKYISPTSRQHIVDIITNAHNQWYFPNKNNINFNNINFCIYGFDAGNKIFSNTKSHYEYTPDYKVAVSYRVLGYYECPFVCDDKNIPLPNAVLYQYLCNIKIKTI